MSEKIKHTNFLLLLLLVGVATFVSCRKKELYADFYTMGGKGWDIDSIARFNVAIPDNKSVYNFYIDSRNLESYPFNNIWLYVKIKAPDESIVRDTVEIQLAQPNGKWLGKGTSGVYYNEFEFKNSIYFPIPGEYKISIKHAMRPDNLIGIKDIGIRIVKK